MSVEENVDAALEVEQKLLQDRDEIIKQIYIRRVKYCTQITLILSVYSYLLGMYLCFIGIAQSFSFNANESKFSNATLEKPFPMPLWYPFNKQKHYKKAMAYQLAEIMLTAMYSSSVHAFNNTVIIFMVLQCEILQHYLENFHLYCSELISENNNRRSKMEVTLKFFIKKHHQLIRWMENLNNSFKDLIFIEYTVSSLLIAAVAVQIVMGKELVFNSIYLCLIISQFMMLAWNANQIQIQVQFLQNASKCYFLDCCVTPSFSTSIEVANSLYNSKWYEQDTRTKMLVLFMIARSQKPFQLQIGPFGAFTVHEAISRIKLAYSYLSLMSATS